MQRSPADYDWVHRMAAGDEAAIRELYAAYGQRLHAYALRLADSADIAEDIVQDSLIAAWRGARRFRGESSVATWLLSIVHHTAIKALRHTAQPISEEMERTLVAPGVEPEAQMQVNERARWLRRALQSLSRDHRAVLELVFYQGLSLNEAATVCGCPVGTIKSRLSYARQRLRDALCDSGQEVEKWE